MTYLKDRSFGTGETSKATAPRKSGRRPGAAARGLESFRELRLLQEIAVQANEARTTREALSFVVRKICRQDGWDVGHAFLLRQQPDRRLLPTPSLWTCSAPWRHARFRSLTMRSKFEIGQGGVGGVAQRRQPEWLDHVTDASPPARFTDSDLGLRSGLLVPVVVRGEPAAAAVLEFYSVERRSKSGAQLRMASSVGALLGRVFERERAERELAQSREAEQRRIGRELHDTVSQELTGITMLGERLVEQLERERSEVSARMQTLVEHVSRVRARVHALSRGLLPVEIEASGLRRALQYLAENAREMHGLDCRVTGDEAAVVEDNVVANHLARIAQESIQNAAKHAGAERVDLALTRAGSCVILTITDDGIGFSPDHRKEGVGIRLMRYRAEVIGAELTVSSEGTGRGTRVRCEWHAD